MTSVGAMLPAMRAPRPFACLLLTGLLAAAASSACNANTVCKVGGPINDASNWTLRRSLMSFGLGQFCQQMTTRSAPLKLSPDAPVTGRFYPQHCTQQMLDNGDLWIQFDGIGYAFTPLSRKVSFTSSATIQYNQDFRCAADNAIFAYFDTRTVSRPDFRIVQIEQPVANLMQNWIAPFAESFGQQMVTGELGKGFTVIQGDDNSTDFDVGHLPVGTRPVHPFNLHGDNRITADSQRTQVYSGERDFIGPINVQDNGRALYVTMQLDGQQAVDVFVVPKGEGDASLQLYVNYGQVGPLAYPPRFTDVVRAGAQYQRAVPVPPGMYYVVIDNTTSAGQVAPSVLPFAVAESPANVNYAIQIGDAK